MNYQFSLKDPDLLENSGRSGSDDSYITANVEDANTPSTENTTISSDTPKLRQVEKLNFELYIDTENNKMKSFYEIVLIIVNAVSYCNNNEKKGKMSYYVNTFIDEVFINKITTNIEEVFEFIDNINNDVNKPVKQHSWTRMKTGNKYENINNDDYNKIRCLLLHNIHQKLASIQNKRDTTLVLTVFTYSYNIEKINDVSETFKKIQLYINKINDYLKKKKCKNELGTYLGGKTKKRLKKHTKTSKKSIGGKTTKNLKKRRHKKTAKKTSTI